MFVPEPNKKPDEAANENGIATFAWNPNKKVSIDESLQAILHTV